GPTAGPTTARTRAGRWRTTRTAIRRSSAKRRTAVRTAGGGAGRSRTRRGRGRRSSRSCRTQEGATLFCAYAPVSQTVIYAQNPKAGRNALEPPYGAAPKAWSRPVGRLRKHENERVRRRGRSRPADP